VSASGSHHCLTHDLSLQQRLLLRLVRRNATGLPLAAHELAILGDGQSQEDFFSLATSHGVQGQVLWRLAQPGDPPLAPAPLGARARGTLRQLRSEAVLWDLERDRLIACLAAHGLTPVALKGAALRHTVYSDPVQRLMADIDLLVGGDEVDEAVDTLQRLGYHKLRSDAAIEAYRRHHFHIRLANAGFLVEVHWGLTRPGRPFRLDAEPMLRRAIVCRRPGRPALRVPSPEDMILHTVSQNLDDGVRMVRLVDIDRVVRASERLEWDYLWESARAGGLQVGLAVALRLCDVLLDTPIPHGQLERSGVGPLTRLHLALMRPQRWPVSPPPDRAAVNELRLLWCTADWRGRLRLLGQLTGKRGDPLRWVWEERSPDVGNSSLLKGATRLVKMLSYQAWLYMQAAAACTTAAGRRQLHLWR